MISGKMRHGKDTCAQFIKEELERMDKRVLIIHYADYLKFILKQYFGWDGEKNEEGRKLLQTFIDVNLFDEIRVFHSAVAFGNGVKAPKIALDADEELKIGSDILKIYKAF